ncbi:hypothetical protein MNBD_GAMMA04-609, partial [hydrothermal vent metagenome]
MNEATKIKPYSNGKNSEDQMSGSELKKFGLKVTLP